MTPLVWANFPLALLFVLAFAGVPLWMTFKRPERGPDFSEARAYLNAKQALISAEAAEPAGMTTARRHASADRRVAPGRRHAGAAPSQRRHADATRQHTGAST